MKAVRGWRSWRSCRRPLALAAAAGAGLALAVPAAAQAHGLFLTPTLPVPTWLFGVAAAAVVVLSFLALAFLWPTPQLAGDSWRPIVPRLSRVVCSPAAEALAGAIGVALLVLVVYAGFAGVEDSDSNIATVFVFIVFWVGLAPVSVLVGNVFRAFNPWRAIGRAAGWLAQLYIRAPDEVVSEPPLRYPEWLGRFPAAAGLFGFAYLELVSARTPHDVALSAAVYTGLTLVAMALFGVEQWCQRGEAFSVYFDLYSRVGALEVRARQLGTRRPLSALAGLRRTPGTTALLAVMIGAVSYDGFSGTHIYQRLLRHFVSGLGHLGAGTQTATRYAEVVSLAVMIALVYAFYRLGVAAARALAGGAPGSSLALAFVPSLVPIALAYVLAHNMQLLLLGGQSIINTASNPLGHHLDLFGTADFEANLGLLSAQAFWYLEVGAIVVGHVLGITLAHDLALSTYRRIRDAVRSQYVMLSVMVGFTVFALWLLAKSSEL